jgi:hypothetical protein
MSRVRKGLFRFGVLVEAWPGLVCLAAAVVLAVAGVSATISGFVGLVGAGLLFIVWLRLS